VWSVLVAVHHRNIGGPSITCEFFPRRSRDVTAIPKLPPQYNRAGRQYGHRQVHGQHFCSSKRLAAVQPVRDPYQAVSPAQIPGEPPRGPETLGIELSTPVRPAPTWSTPFLSSPSSRVPFRFSARILGLFTLFGRVPRSLSRPPPTPLVHAVSLDVCACGTTVSQPCS
jgi:hypothetical protein